MSEALLVEGIRLGDEFMWRSTLWGLTTPLTVTALYWVASVAYIVRCRSKEEERRTRRRTLMRPLVPFLALYVVHCPLMACAQASMAELGQPGAETGDGAFLLCVTASFAAGGVAMMYSALYLRTTQGLATANVLLTAAFFRDSAKVQALVDTEDTWRWGAEDATRVLRGAAIYALYVAALLTFGGFTMRYFAASTEELLRTLDVSKGQTFESRPAGAHCSLGYPD